MGAGLCRWRPRAAAPCGVPAAPPSHCPPAPAGDPNLCGCQPAGRAHHMASSACSCSSSSSSAVLAGACSRCRCIAEPGHCCWQRAPSAARQCWAAGRCEAATGSPCTPGFSQSSLAQPSRSSAKPSCGNPPAHLLRWLLGRHRGQRGLRQLGRGHRRRLQQRGLHLLRLHLLQAGTQPGWRQPWWAVPERATQAFTR